MPTLLTNRKMDPALVARIEASLRRSTGRAGRGVYRPSLVAVVRVLVVAAIVGVVASLVVARARARERLERRRTALIDESRAHAATLTDEERTVLVRAEDAVHLLAGPYQEDLLDRALRVDDVLAAPAMYVRGNLADFDARPVARASEDGRKDAFVACLYAPPAARDENAMLATVRELREGDALERRTPKVALLRDAEAGLPYLLPDFAAHVASARPKELVNLEEAFRHAPIEAAKKAAHARYLIVALDEGSGFAFDGDFAHDVRVAIVDLRSTAVLLRIRKRVDPSWVSVPRRAKYSVDLDGCLLALDVRQGMAK